MRTLRTALSALTALGLMQGHHQADASPALENRAQTGRAACQPVQRELAISLGARKNSASFRVPAGRRLAIEYLSVHGELPFGQNLLVELQTTLHGTTATHFVVPSRLDWQRIPATDYDIIRLRQWLRVHADGDTDVVITTVRSGNWGAGRASVTVAGCLAQP